MSRRHSSNGRRIVTGSALASLALLAVAPGCRERPAPAPARQPVTDVRITELSPEVADQLADRVAERVADRVAERVADRVDAQPPTVAPRPPTRPVIDERPVVVVRPAAAPPRRADRPPRPRPTPPPPTHPLDDATLAEAQDAVDRALEWLSRTQAAEGQWEADLFAREDAAGSADGPGQASYTPGVTGLALRCFLAAGQTHQSGAHKDTVKRGLRYLKTVQDSEGCFGPRTSAHFQYNHASAALAMVEAYVATRSELFAQSAQRAVDFVHSSQNPYLGWRYGIRDGDNDTSVTGWMVQVLRAAESADLAVDRGAYRGAVTWVDKMTEPEFGRVGYQRRGGPPARTTEQSDRFPADLSESLTAIGMCTRVAAGQKPAQNEFIRKGADLLANQLPNWDRRAGSIDLYYWHWGTRAMADVGGDHWRVWSRALVRALAGNQRDEGAGAVAGSWDPAGPWGVQGGRFYATALGCLSLQQVLQVERER